MVAWRSGHVEGDTGDWFNWSSKAIWLTQVLRDRWMAWDFGSAMLLAILVVRAACGRSLRFTKALAVPALFLFATFILLPRIVLGSAYADMRLAPSLLAIAVIAIRTKPETAKLIAIAGLAFFAARIVGNSASLWIEDRAYQRELAALDHVPIGAPLVSLVAEGCGDSWSLARMRHLPSFALFRRLAFANDGFVTAGAHMLQVRIAGAGKFGQDPSQIVYSKGCPLGQNDVDAAAAEIDRTPFSHLWMIRLTPPRALSDRLQMIWSNGGSAVYRIRGHRRSSDARS
jgi:hypothetical protein